MLLHGTPASAVFSSHMHGYLQDACLRAQLCKETAQPSPILLHKTTLFLDYKLDIKLEQRLCNYSCHTAQRAQATALQRVLAHGRVCLVLGASPSSWQERARKSSQNRVFPKHHCSGAWKSA